MPVPKPNPLVDLLTTIRKFTSVTAAKPVSVGELHHTLTQLGLALSDYVQHSEERIGQLTLRVGQLEAKK